MSNSAHRASKAQFRPPAPHQEYGTLLVAIEHHVRPPKWSSWLESNQHMSLSSYAPLLPVRTVSVAKGANDVTLSNLCQEDFCRSRLMDSRTNIEKLVGSFSVVKIHCPTRMALTAICARNLFQAPHQVSFRCSILSLVFSPTLVVRFRVLLVMFPTILATALLAVGVGASTTAKSEEAFWQAFLAAGAGDHVLA